MLLTCFTLLLFFQEASQEAAQVASIEKLRTQVQQIDDRVNRLTDKLQALDVNSQKLSDEVGRLELQRALITAKVEKYETELAQAKDEITLNEGRRDQLRGQAEAGRAKINKRLRQLYKRGTLGHSQILLKQSQREELLNAYHYAQVLTRRDHNAIQEYNAAIVRLNEVKKHLLVIREEADKARAGLDKERAQLKQLLKERNAKLREIRKESKSKQRLLEDLELEKDEMLTMVRRIIEQEKDPLEIQVPITRYKGRLPWPSKGRLKNRFGIYKDRQFSTRQMRNGIDIAAPLGSPVNAVYSGRVLFADWFKSYGNVIIIDHGTKVISFYAHCETLKVKAGEYVERSQVIATSGDTGSLDGAILHFEIREKTVPVDPIPWLKRK